jgi:hypothetical protein
MAETTYETVKMSDGRLVDFPGKRQLIKTSSLDGMSVTLDFRNGETRVFTLPPAMVNQFALHGAEQKLGDEIAGLKEIDDAVMAVDELIDRLYNGEWGVKREASGMAGTSVLARALVEVTGKPIEKIKEFLKAKTQAEKIALRADARIKAVVDRLEAAKVAKGTQVDTSALLNELA